MCPFAVLGLGLRYLRMSIFIIFGHPLRKPFVSLSIGWRSLDYTEIDGQI